MSIAVAREPLPPTVALPFPPPEAPEHAAQARPPNAPDAASAPDAPNATAQPSAFAGLLRSLAREVHRGESLTRSALGAASAGQALGPAELIALQAGIYRYGEAVDLASRLIDRATSAVKTVVQGT
jgi:hypothetical protein